MKIIFTKSAILLVCFFSVVIKINAQLASTIPHIFSVTAATPPAFPAAGVVNIVVPAVPATNIDEWDTLFAPAAWSITFAGTAYSKVCVSTNGWLALVPGSVPNPPWPTPQILPPNPTNLLNNNTTGYPIIAPLWDDLSCNLVSYAVVANVLWIRWNVKWNKTHASAASPLVYASLNGTTGVINFYYTNNAIYVPVTPSASIGIAGVCTGDFYSVKTTANNAATVDSVTENTTIGPTAGPAPNFRPYNCSYTFTPIASGLNDNCGSAKDMGAMTTTCNYVSVSTFGATTSGSPLSCNPDVKDVWFKYIKPSGGSSVTISTAPASCQSVGTTIEVWSACGGAVLGCATTSVANPNYGEVTLVRPCPAETLWVRVTTDGDVEGRFKICATYVGGNGTTCATPNIICALPYNYSGTTAGSGNDYDSTTSACHTKYMYGEDYVFSYTPPTNQCIQVDLTSAGSNPGIFVYSGCPNIAGTHCLASREFSAGSATINSVSLNAGQTYYIVVDCDTAGGFMNLPFTIDVSNAGSGPAYDICASAVNLGTIINGVNCTPQTFTTECATPTAVGQAGLPTCIPANNPPYFIDGVTGDVWFRFTAGYSGSLQINTYQSAVNPTSNAAMAIYSGATCPSSAAAPYACDYNSGSNGMPSLSIPIVNGTTYYIRVWSEHPENAGNFDICFQSACTPTNDLPCQAVLVPLGGTAAGFNTCAGSNGEPSAPFPAQCIAGGTVNTVWYMAIVPPSGSIRVRTHPLTLTDTQIQGYSFVSGCANAASTNTPRACNDDGTPCSGGFSDFSEQLYSGLVAGETLYVAVDGMNSQTGSFEISFIDGSTTVFPPVNQQDCGAAQVICSTNDVVVANPGFRNNGNICDLPSGYGCWGTGERNSVWYQFTVDPALSGGNATVSFDVTTAASVDIDIIMWDITGNPNACAQIQSQTLAIAGCNYAASNATTGLTTQMPLPYAYSNALTFSGAPRTYVLLLNNWNSSANAGFTLDWNSTPISATTSNAVWTGLTDTMYTTTTNWGDCGSTPTCAVDATINNVPNNRQPTVDVGLPAKSVRNLLINAGAQLRIKAGATLSICGNFTNLGTLICEPGSIIQFIGTGLQTITGSLTGTNSFANLVINKPIGSVQLLNNIDVAENFTISNVNSVFNINGKYMKVGGNFTNYNLSTFVGIGGSTVEFDGILNQDFTNTNGQNNLNRVTINKAAGKLFLNGAFSNLNIDSILNLTQGNIVTTATLEVNVKYGMPAAIINHNTNSYVEGRLRRKVVPFSFGSMDFPVGSPVVPNVASGNGYELANIAFTSSTVIPDLLCWFNVWPGAVPNGPAASECVYATYDILPILDHGYWSFQKSVANFNGNYNVTLHNTGYTNSLGGAGWTVAKAAIASPPLVPASWALLGTCSIPSTAAITYRNQINTPAANVNSFNHLYATVQSTQPLPIELISFTAEPKGEEVLCSWETASETNNEYFEVERSFDGKNYKGIERVRGFGYGTSTESRSYSIVDPDHCFDIRYYRLKQVDFDGRHSYSDPVAINCKITDGIELYPNPANTIINYHFSYPESCQLTVNIMDVSGRVVRFEKINVEKGINNISSKIDDLAAGAYYISIANSENSIVKLQKQFFKN